MSKPKKESWFWIDLLTLGAIALSVLSFVYYQQNLSLRSRITAAGIDYMSPTQTLIFGVLCFLNFLLWGVVVDFRRRGPRWRYILAEEKATEGLENEIAGMPERALSPNTKELIHYDGGGSLQGQRREMGKSTRIRRKGS